MKVCRVLRLKIEMDGETITRAEPDVGYLHRGDEKIDENMTVQTLQTLFQNFEVDMDQNSSKFTKISQNWLKSPKF